MLKIPLHLILKLFNTLGSTPIEVIHDEPRHFLNFYSPLCATIIKDPNIDEPIPSYLLYLCELISLKTINGPEVISNEFGTGTYFTNNGSSITWFIKYKETFIESGVNIAKFVMDLNFTNRALNAYEQWILDFFAARELLLSLNASTDFHSFLIKGMKSKSNETEVLIQHHKYLKSAKEELLNTMNLILSKFPLGDFPSILLLEPIPIKILGNITTSVIQDRDINN